MVNGMTIRCWFCPKRCKRTCMKKIKAMECIAAGLLLLSVQGCSTPHQTSTTSSKASTAQATPPSAPQSKSSASLSDSAALQGIWSGRELSADSDEPCRLIVSGQNFEFHGPDANEWYKGTFTLREDSNPKVLVASITDCPVDKYIGKTDYAIYRLENGTLTLTAREPGNPDLPSGFDATETRQFVFKSKP